MFLLYFFIFIIFLSVVFLVIGLFNFYSEHSVRKKVDSIIKSKALSKENLLKSSSDLKKYERFLKPVFKYSIENLDDHLSEVSLKFIHADLTDKKEQLIFLLIKIGRAHV